MDKTKQWIALAAVAVLAVLAGGWFLLVSPKRAEAADVRSEVDQTESQSNLLRTQLAMLKAQAKTLPQVQAKLAAVAAKVPDNPALPALIRAMSKAADESGVELVTLSPGTPAAVASGAPGAAAQPAATAGTSRVTSGTTPGGAATAGTLQAIPLSVNVVGGYFQIEQFFDRLENLSRAFKVTAFTLGEGKNPLKAPSASAPAVQDDGRSLAATITASVYMASGRSIAVQAAPGASK